MDNKQKEQMKKGLVIRGAACRDSCFYGKDRKLYASL